MARGRITQLRLHAINQASLVWAVTGELTSEQLERFLRTGQMDESQPERIPYDPKVLEQLQARI